MELYTLILLEINSHILTTYNSTTHILHYFRVRIFDLLFSLITSFKSYKCLNYWHTSPIPPLPRFLEASIPSKTGSMPANVLIMNSTKTKTYLLLVHDSYIATEKSI